MKKKPPSLSLIKRILMLALPEWKALGLGTIFLLIGSMTTLIYPQAVRLVIDQSLESKQFSEINRTAMWLLIIFAIQGAAVSLRYFIYTYTGEKIVNRLRKTLFKAISHREIAFFDANRTGELLSRITSDTTVLQNTVTVNISMALRNSIMTLGGVAFLIYHSPRLSSLILLIVPVVILATLLFGRQIRRTSRLSQDALAEANQIAEECISSIRTVRSFSAEPHENLRYRNALERALKTAGQRMRQIAIFQGISSFAGFGVIALILWYGGHMVYSGTMTVGALTSFLLYTGIVAFSLAALGSLWADFMRAGGAAERVFELIDQHTQPDGPLKKVSSCKGRVEFKGVWFNYPTRKDLHVLNGIDLNLAQGETVALVGPSGSGKSTITSLLLGFYPPDKGVIQIDDIPVQDIDMHHFREHHVALVAQEPVLFSESILENIRYGRPEASRAEVETAAQKANAMEFIQEFPDGLETQVGERGVKLSGGQKQRVAIARAILKDPAILILDEATSALDTQSEALVKDALQHLMGSRTTLIVAHRLSTVQDANRIAVIEKGKLVQSGSHSQLLQEADGMYAQLIKNQLLSEN